jgi:hypothetical protein
LSAVFWQEYAAAMKFTTTPLLMLLGVLAVVVVSGCAAPRQEDLVAEDFLGAGPVHILSDPSRVEGWNFQRADGSIMADAPLRPLDVSVGKELGKILLNDSTYRQPARDGAFEHTVGFRIWRGSESIDVILSLGNDQVQIKSMGNNGQPISQSAGVTAAHDALVGVARKAFPELKVGGK